MVVAICAVCDADGLDVVVVAAIYVVVVYDVYVVNDVDVVVVAIYVVCVVHNDNIEDDDVAVVAAANGEKARMNPRTLQVADDA